MSIFLGDFLSLANLLVFALLGFLTSSLNPLEANFSKFTFRLAFSFGPTSDLTILMVPSLIEHFTPALSEINPTIKIW
ncbi:hypothetical protein SAMN05216575_108126 [Ectopseudomonas alcaliphila]|uniref:Uncharacterized protein n=1 Tax=Ectopseudomonas alcaliphila TaxID=101564 RepID=A0A1G7LI02_9GAMM|nr:hypothetical protein SAMN05216575_108126 [Pseudomonas alcaliphila]